MKVLENVKNGNIRTIKVLGFSLYVKENFSEYKSQKILNGIIVTDTILNGNVCEKTIKILGISIFKRTDEVLYKKYYIGSLLIKTEDLRISFKKRYCKYIDKIFDDVYILNSASGEAYLFLAHAQEFINKNGSKKPLFIAQEKYHVDLIKMLCPQITYEYIPNIKNILQCEMFEVYNQRFFIMFPSSHYVKLEKDIHNGSNGTVHYYSRILEYLKLDKKNITAQTPLLSNEAKQTMLNKVNEIDLNLNKFIFISSEARSNPSLSDAFWNKLSLELNRLGYDIFVNVISFKTDLKTLKSCFLSFEEAYALAQISKGIVALRSGFVEYLSTINNIPIICLYTPFNERGSLKSMPADNVLSSFTLKQLPNIKRENIFEYNTETIGEANLIKKIILNL